MNDTATTVGIEVKIVPDGYARGGSVLRAVLILSPSETGNIVLADWPKEVSRILGGLRITLADIPSGQNPDPATSTPVSAVVRHDTGHIDQASALWRILMSPPISASTAGDVSAAFSQLAEHLSADGALSTAYAAALKRAQRPWSTLQKAIALSSSWKRMAVYTGTQTDPLKEKLRISDVPSADLASAFRLLGSMRYLYFMADAAPDLGTIRAFGPRTEIWSGLAALQQGAPEDIANKTETAETLIVKSLGRRGLEAAIAVSDAGANLNAVDVFSRKPAPPAPEPRLSSNMVGVVKRVRGQAARIERSTPRLLKTEFLAPDSGLEKQLLLISPKNSAWLSRPTVSRDPLIGDIRSLLASGHKPQTGGTLQTFVQDTVVQHLIALREDPLASLREPQVQHVDNSVRSMRAPELRALLTAVNDAMSKRLYGVQAYPALARVLKLAIDIEIDVSGLPAKWRPGAGGDPAAGEGAIFFAMSASLVGGPDSDRLWTACRLTAKSFVAACREELEMDAADRKNGPNGSLAPLLSTVDPPTFQGIWNLGATLQDNPRFMVTSLDTTSRAEQLLNVSQGTAQSSKTAQGLPDESAHGPARTNGLTIVDSSRGADVQRVAAAAIETRAKARADHRLLLADDVTVGYRLDVGVVPAGGHDLTWRSLMRRTLTFGKTADGLLNVQALVDATLSAAAPETGNGAAAAFGARLAEASFRSSARVVSSQTQNLPDDLKAAEIIAQQNVVEWHADPLGAPCGEMQTEAHDGLTELLLDVTMDLPKGKDSKGILPPRQQIGRPYWFAARAMYLGGAGPSLEEVEPVYRRGRGGRLTLPRRDDPGEVFRRQERVAAPKVALLYRNGRAVRDRRGETLEKLVLRTGDREAVQTGLVQRLIYAPAVPQAFAAIHPDPHDRGGNALDHTPIAGKRPLGGLINVDVEPETGGLRVQKSDGSVGDSKRIPDGIPIPNGLNTAPDEGVFRVCTSSAKDLKARKSHYYPDPLADALMLELWTTEGAPSRVAGPITVPIMDKAYRQAVDDDFTGADSVACGYPFAMPVLLDVREAAWDAVTELRFNPRDDTGWLDDQGRFSWLSPGGDPPGGSVTVRRVTARVRAGETLQLKVWCRTPPERLDFFASFHEAIRLLQRLRIPHREGGAPLSQTVRATLGLRLPAFTGDARSQETQLIRYLAEVVSRAAHPEQAEILQLDLVHAVQRPRTPAWVCGAIVCRGEQKGKGREQLAVLRRPAGNAAAWRTWLAAGTHADSTTWGPLSAPAATTATFGGPLAIDVAAAAAVQLEVRCRDFRDEGGKPLPYLDGRFDFPYIGPLTCSAPLLGQDRRPLTFVGEKLAPFDLVASPGGAPRDLTIHLPDPRAYRLEVTPTTGSRYINYLDPKPEAASRAAYASRGETVEVWAAATVRPSAMGHISLLPVFVWEELHGGGERRTRMRLSWRRPQPRPPTTPSARPPDAGWFSSGEGERLGIVFAPAAPDKRIGQVAAYLSQWGGDAIRTGTPPPEGGLRDAISVMPLSPNDDGTRPSSWAKDQWMPFPGDRDRAPVFLPPGAKAPPADLATHVDLLTLEPEYDPNQELWYTDVDIDAATLAGPWVRLGLVRYQPYAISDGTAAGDMHVSEPTRVEFRLEPSRIVEVVAERRDKETGLWPLRVTVRGPNSVVAGGRGRQSTPEENAALATLSRPRFKLAILGRPIFLLDSFGQPGGDITIAEQTSDGCAPPSGDILWTTTIHLRHNPSDSTHYAYIEEVDAMLPANRERYPIGHLIESGPRFMAKVRIRRAH